MNHSFIHTSLFLFLLKYLPHGSGYLLEKFIGKQWKTCWNVQCEISTASHWSNKRYHVIKPGTENMPDYFISLKECLVLNILCKEGEGGGGYTFLLTKCIGPLFFVKWHFKKQHNIQHVETWTFLVRFFHRVCFRVQIKQQLNTPKIILSQK